MIDYFREFSSYYKVILGCIECYKGYLILCKDYRNYGCCRLCRNIGSSMCFYG